MFLSTHQKMIIIEILNKHDIKKAGIFGSYAKGEAMEGISDLDLVVELSKNNLFALASLKNELEKKLNLNVDIITYGGLKKFARKELFKQEVINYHDTII